MHKEFLMGNAAIARGAVAAGLNVISGYPGTPSTEVLETAAKYNDGSIYVEWSVNEKAALELGAGAAYCGARSMVTMKQVGLNVASDPLMSLAYIGVKGGMVIMVADDPGPISFSSLWSILELFKQRRRVEKGWFPKNPKRK